MKSIFYSYLCAANKANEFNLLNVMNNYETVFIVTPVLSDAQVQEVADKFQGVITENGGQIVNKESWEIGRAHV